MVFLPVLVFIERKQSSLMLISITSGQMVISTYICWGRKNGGVPVLSLGICITDFRDGGFPEIVFVPSCLFVVLRWE